MVMPSMMGFMANYIIPISLIVPDMAYPRINNISLWLLPPSIGILILVQ
jgi:cytochrome c oxidase subunit 1